MNESSVYIVTGQIQTGKTTALIEWSDGKNDVFGILTPVIEGKRFFMDAHLRNRFEMEANEGDQEVISIGRFKFSTISFHKATQIINDSIGKGWLVIDEIGPLELNKQGFYEVVKEALLKHFSPVVLVVRESLAAKVADLFELKNYEVISKDQLKTL